MVAEGRLPSNCTDAVAAYFLARRKDCDFGLGALSSAGCDRLCSVRFAWAMHTNLLAELPAGDH